MIIYSVRVFDRYCLIYVVFFCTQTNRCYGGFYFNVPGDGEWNYLCMDYSLRTFDIAIDWWSGVDCCEWISVAFGG